MNKIILSLSVCWFILFDLNGQNSIRFAHKNFIAKSNELLQLQKDRYYNIIGYNDDKLIYQMNIGGKKDFGYSSEAEFKIYYNEKRKVVTDSIYIKREGRRVLKVKQFDELILYHGFYNVPQKFESKLIDELDRGQYLLDYQDFWIEYLNKEYKIKSYSAHYYDKDVNYDITSSGTKVILSTYVSEYLRSTKADSLITIINFNESKSNDFSKQEIACEECIKPQVVDETLFYGQKYYYLPGADAYDWKIYKAPVNDLSQDELLAEYIELVLVSPEGKYILGKKYLYGKLCYVILSTELKKFQYVATVEYFKDHTSFYSNVNEQFAFDTPKNIVYIEFPDEFKINSSGIEAEKKNTSSEENDQFWKNYNQIDNSN
ncbi:hypothetical protein [Marivirga harenae]|uniref:hypothetical protein n=1 Tax=Marivirga harenae TaxID=2010992 RepID=UPI0026DF3C17|nr:hypothetical protein [Marivirga harenae]WKV10940.1 hypothetical protein Q3Y49_12025 [Marivirga harenae]